MKKFFCEGEIIIPLSSYEKTLSSFEKTLSSFEKTLSSFEKTLSSFEKTLSFIFKGRSGSFIAFRDPLVLYTAPGNNERTAVNERMGELVSLNAPTVCINNLTKLGTPQYQLPYSNRLSFRIL